MRIEVGYGLEGTLTDVASSRIIRNLMTPQFKAGSFIFGIIGIFTSIGVMTPGFSGWFLYVFLIPFWAMFPVVIFGMKVTLVVLAVYLVGFPAAKLLLGRTAWYAKAAQDLKTKGRASIGGFTVMGGGFSGGGSSGGGGGFAGGGGSAGGAEAQAAGKRLGRWRTAALQAAIPQIVGIGASFLYYNDDIIKDAAARGRIMRNVKTLGLLGTGVIGGGWAARALHFGIDVIAADVKPEMESWIRGAVANAEPALARLTFAPLPPKGKLSFTTDLRAMAQRADFIQENIPEQLPLKQRILAEVSRHAAADVIIASSTSGLTPTDLQRDMTAPERFCVAHPFNPVYLLPLVELVAGAKTAPATIEAAAKFFTYIGMHALRVRREVPGHLKDRLQEAIWREILHMVNDGVATTGELDESIIYGPGLRWAGWAPTSFIIWRAGRPECGTCWRSSGRR